MELSGRLGAISLAELLQWPHHERRSGALVVRTSRRDKRVLFVEGQIVGCESSNPAEYFGRHLLLNGYVHRQKLLEVLSLCRATGAPLGTALIDLGLLSPAMVAEALRAHVADRVCDLFLWEHGVFYFELGLPPGGDLLQQPLDPLSVALEGSRWVDELARIRQVLVHDGLVLARAAGAAPSPGGDALERRLLEALEGPQRLDAIYEQVQGSHFRFLSAAYRLLVAGTLEVDRLEEDDEAKRSTAVALYELMLDEAAEEELLLSARHLALPIEWLDRFFPLWVEAADGAAPGLTREDAEFCRQLDGSRSLQQLLQLEPPKRKQRLELVLLQLRNGQLALLPRPLAELRALGEGARNPWFKKLWG
jgi:hypothetical protein